MGVCCSVSAPQPPVRRRSSAIEASSPPRVMQRNRRLGPVQTSPRATPVGGRQAHASKTTTGTGPVGSGSLNTATSGTNPPDSSASGTSAPLTLHNLQQHTASWSSPLVSCAPLPRFPGDSHDLQIPQGAHQELDEVVVHVEEGLLAPDTRQHLGAVMTPVSGSAHSALSAHQVDFGVAEDVSDEDCEHFEPLQMPSHLWAISAQLQ